jgi:3-hydroxybutyryl-CoA dehydrogenase
MKQYLSLAEKPLPSAQPFTNLTLPDFHTMDTIGILGAGAMGSGIAQVAAAAGHNVVVCDNHTLALSKSGKCIQNMLRTGVEKGKLTDADAYSLFSRIRFTDHMSDFRECGVVIEAIVEDIELKQIAFKSMEAVVGHNTILASNTSSLSISAMGAHMHHPERIVGIHFFNPAPLMRLVEIIPAIQTNKAVVERARQLISGWGKTTVLAKDTPGFIVNRIARPYYGEALRLLEEGIADEATIDWAMRELGGFRMGPFELMDFIGNDINYTVTEAVFVNFYYDPRYKPSFTQKRLVDAHYFGQKSGRGFYDYRDSALMPLPVKDEALGHIILRRILAMLINEAAEALHQKVASRDDIDLAMTQGVNYPKGLLAWADLLGISSLVDDLDALHAEYLDDRYRCSPLLRKMAKTGGVFY